DRFPKIHTSLEEMSNEDQLFAIQHNKLDIGFIRAKQAPEGIAFKQIFKDNFSIVLPKNHRINENNFTDLSQFAQDNFILFSSDYSRTYYNKVMSIFDDHGFAPKISHKSVHANTIFRLVENGLGVAIVPTSLKHGFDLDIKFIELKNVKQITYLSLIWKEGTTNELIKKFVSLVG
ncbi:MAG: LysR substrate-binding domain-containing protein, partial [Cyclobacteriaceae bacterium]